MTANALEHIEAVKRVISRSQQTSSNLTSYIKQLQKDYQILKITVQNILQHTYKNNMTAARDLEQEMVKAFTDQRQLNEQIKKTGQGISLQILNLVKDCKVEQAKNALMQQTLGSYN